MSEPRRTGRRIAFWTGVAGVSVLSDVTMSALARRFPNGPFARFKKFVFGQIQGS